MKNITLRNLLGGFLGGLLGILMFRLFHWYTLPLGCLVGVTVGWFHREVWVALCSFSKVPQLAKTLGLSEALSATMHTVGRTVGNIPSAYRHRVTDPETGHGLFFTLSVATAALVWFSVYSIPFVFLYYLDTKATGPSLVIIAVNITLVIAAVISILAFCFTYSENSCRWYKGGEKLYSQSSAIQFWGKSTLITMLFSFVFSVVVWLGLLQAAVASMAFILYAIPWSFKMLFQKTGHWACFGITLATTSIVAWLGRPYLANSIGLWLVALTAGTVSGGSAVVAGYVLGSLSHLSAKPEKIFGKVFGDASWVDAVISPFANLGNSFGRRLGVPRLFE